MEEEKEKKNPFHREYGVFSNIGYIFNRMFRYDKGVLVLMGLGMLVAPFFQYLWTFLSKYIIDAVTEGKPTKQLLLIIACFGGIQLLITMVNSYCENDIWWRFIRVRTWVMMELNRKAVRVDYPYLENPDAVGCHEKAQNAVGGNSEGVEGMMHELHGFFKNLMVVIVGIVILGTLNPLVILAMVIIAVLTFLVTNRSNKICKTKVWDPLAVWWRKRWYMKEMTTNFEAAKDIRMYGIREWIADKYRLLNETRLAAQKKNERIWFVSSIFSAVLWLGSQALVYAWLIRSVVNKGMTIGNFSLYLASSTTFFTYISSILNGMSNFLQRSREIDDFRSFLDIDKEEAVDEGKELPELTSYEFTFENVSFTYPRADKPALKNLNLKIAAGERLAVVGLNGAGKTTMIKLMLRLYEPSEGRILLNGVDIREYKKTSYYHIFAPVFQKVELFAFPMDENVSMKRTSETDSARAEQCLRDAGMGEKVDSLPNGVKTELLKILDEEGVDLSGGEKQKLGLARALYKNAPVILLDEPTAALDALAEASLYESFDRLIGGKTAVYISHRLSSTQFCSHVAMFADGEMKEYGTHEELMKQGGEYAHLFEVQAQYYLEGKEEEPNEQ